MSPTPKRHETDVKFLRYQRVGYELVSRTAIATTVVVTITAVITITVARTARVLSLASLLWPVARLLGMGA